MRAAAIALIFVAVAQVYLGGSRGLKIMRHTLYAYWIGQSVGWIVITLVLWAAIDKTVAVTTWAYGLSWVLATGIAFVSGDTPRARSRRNTIDRVRPGRSFATARRGRPPRC